MTRIKRHLLPWAWANCRKGARYRRRLAQAEALMTQELDLRTYFRRSRLHYFGVKALLDGRQKLIAHRMSNMVV